MADSAEALRTRALKEVGETTPAARTAALAALKERIAGYNAAHAGERHGLFGRGPLKGDVAFARADDEAFLLAMLRGAKFDVDKALAKEVAYSRFVQENRDWCQTPDLDVVARVFSSAFVFIPQRDALGRRVWFSRIKGQLDLVEAGDVSAENIVRASFWVMQGVAGRDDVLSLEGVVLVQDMADVSVLRMNRVFPQKVNQAAAKQAGVFPWRLKRIAVLNEPRWIGFLFALIRPFLPDKMGERARMYGEDYAKLCNELGAAALPRECGGQAKLDPKESAERALRLVAQGYPQMAEEVNEKIAGM